MSSSLYFRPSPGFDCGCPLQAAGTSSYSSSYCSTTTSHGRARCGAMKPTSCKIIGSLTSDAAKVNHIASNSRVSNSNGSINSTSGLPMDISLLHTQLRSDNGTDREIPLDVPDRGRLVDNGLVYRQTFVIRSYEVGFDRTAPIDTMTNLFQETSLNHVRMMDFVGDGMGTTHEMARKRLIWVVTRMHIEMTQYPSWGDVVQIDSWVGSCGKNGMRRDFLVQDYSTGHILGWATSNWAMMNQDTRKLSKMPEEVRAEIAPYFMDRSVMGSKGEPLKRIPLLEESAPFREAGLLPKVHDLDMNQHVNHVKYIDWMLECLPQSLLMSCELRAVILEYRRECSKNDTVVSLAQPNTTTSSGETAMGSLDFTHSLRLCGSGIEVLRGHTQWTPKRPKQHHHH